MNKALSIRKAEFLQLFFFQNVQYFQQEWVIFLFLLFPCGSQPSMSPEPLQLPLPKRSRCAGQVCRYNHQWRFYRTHPEIQEGFYSSATASRFYRTKTTFMYCLEVKRACATVHHLSFKEEKSWVCVRKAETGAMVSCSQTCLFWFGSLC